MTYLSRCLIGRTIPTLPNILRSTSSSYNQKAIVPVAIRAYASSVLTKNASKVCLQNINQQSKKFAGPLTLFANQIRASSTDHVRLWQLERLVAAAFIVVFPSVILLQNSLVDLIFSVLTVVHFHWGLEAIIVDYARPAVVGPVLPKALMGLLYAISIATLAGLGALIFNGPGVGGSIKKLWIENKK
ncbi:succinate dehydrogenase [ubiquinone] cytochrome b small subunit, mitochondrial [Chelonus insularis]|uniref:succinate dehydrogenase [ubiquinone] cytochrome b small subunit, mitochondrial n=1 Tax=Chelonus insularis TaxID=460826 RepID=UPI00158F0669|nr:succinate dehydrogenase [ubiquinone] cytochrome b small subunit, mitochondrial [Chelonus insularis]